MRFAVVGIKEKKSGFQLIAKKISKFSLSAKANFGKPNCTNQTLQRKSRSAAISLHFKTLHIFLSSFFKFLFLFITSLFALNSSSITFTYLFFRSRKNNTKSYNRKQKKSVARNIVASKICMVSGFC